jgi:type II secretory pathway component PulJ
MFGLRALRHAHHGRPFWLLAALAVALLVSVSTTMASTASALALVEGLQRDLSAVRAQLERADPGALGVGQQSVAFNADLGDGGTAFRHRSMATILRSANRRLENLVTGYRRAGDARRAAMAETAQLELQELDRRLRHLGNAKDATSIMWARKHLEASALLDELQNRVVMLMPMPNAERAAG